jgi:hypothetical protein
MCTGTPSRIGEAIVEAGTLRYEQVLALAGIEEMKMAT